MNFAKAEFIRSAASPEQFLRDGLPQFAFAGRSNVGKSSVIKRLLDRKNLAYVGSSPGKTSQVNYFLVDSRAYLVDLPGYGYANANVSVKEKWGKMIERYLHTSEMMYAVFLLIDIRHEPGKNDRQMYEWMTAQGYFPIIIATKMDKLKRSQIEKHVKMIREGLDAPQETIVIPFSSMTKQGREEIYALLDDMLNSFAEDEPAEEP